MQILILYRLLDKTYAEFEEKIVDGKVLLFTRNGVFQVRLYKGNRQYIYKSLKTRDSAKARELAVRAHYELEFHSYHCRLNVSVMCLMSMNDCVRTRMHVALIRTTTKPISSKQVITCCARYGV